MKKKNKKIKKSKRVKKKLKNKKIKKSIVKSRKRKKFKRNKVKPSKSLNIKKMILVTRSPKKVVSLEGFGIKIIKQEIIK